MFSFIIDIKKSDVTATCIEKIKILELTESKLQCLVSRRTIRPKYVDL